MRKTKVKKHTRKTKNGASVVRRHTRSLKKSNLVKHFKNRYGIKSKIEIKDGDYDDPEGTSLAMTESTLDKETKEPIDHKVLIKESKVKDEGENMNTLIHHELSHILAREKKIEELDEYEELMDAVKETDTYKEFVEENSDYADDPEEIFSRIYSQHQTGDTSSNDYLFSREEMKDLEPLMTDLLEAVKGDKESVKKESKTHKGLEGGLKPSEIKDKNSKEGTNMKPGVLNYAKSSESDKKRWVNWATRFYGRKKYPPLKDEKGNPTRFALTAERWGEKIPTTEKEARAIYKKALKRKEELNY